MSVTLHEMENTISSFPDIGLGGDAGNTIDVTDVTDDLGMNLLANTRYMDSGSQSSRPTSTISLGGNNSPQNTRSVQPIASSLQEVEFTNVETLQPISIDNTPQQFGSVSVNYESNNYNNNSSSGVQYDNQQSSTASSMNFNPAPTTSLVPPMDPEEERKKKTEFINKLQRLEQKGFPVSKRFTMDNSLDEIKAEYTRLVDARQLETSIRFQRNMLMGFVTGLEWMNNKFDPFDVKLDGWSESVHENVEDYDEIFEELYDKYKERGQMPPEARLLFQLAGSGFMCHISNSFFRAKMPSAGDVLKNNPELAKQFAAAAASQAGSGFGNFMGMAMGVPPQGQQQQPSVPSPSSISQERDRDRAGVQSMPSMSSGLPTGAFFNSSSMAAAMPQQMAAQPAPQVARREMKGPSGVDDILRTFEQAREAEAAMSVHSSMQMPPSPAALAAAEIQSMHSEEMTSVAQSERTAGGRRRQRKAPTGNMISLNV
jgi:hypothetical protein